MTLPKISSDNSSATAGISNLISNTNDRSAKSSAVNLTAQNQTALAFLTNALIKSKAVSTASAQKTDVGKTLYKISVRLPEGREAADYEQLERAVIKTIFEKNGIFLSRAALEDIAGKVSLDFTPAYDRTEKKFVFNAKNGLMAEARDLRIGGQSAKGYEFSISAETEQAVLSHAKLAQAVTVSGKKHFPN